MARSKKEQVNIKLNMAKTALEAVITGLSNDLTDKTKDECRKNEALWKKWLARESFLTQHAAIMQLFDTAKKKQGSRMILAVCSGELRDGSPCLYKIRASMSTYLRGVPNCPDQFCNHRGKPLEVQIQDDEIEAELNKTLAEEIKDDINRQEKRAQEAKEKFGQKVESVDDKEWNSFLDKAGKL